MGRKRIRPVDIKAIKMEEAEQAWLNCSSRSADRIIRAFTSQLEKNLDKVIELSNSGCEVGFSVFFGIERYYLGLYSTKSFFTTMIEFPLSRYKELFEATGFKVKSWDENKHKKCLQDSEKTATPSRQRL